MIQITVFLSIVLLFAISTVVAATSSIPLTFFEPDPDVPPQVNAKTPSLSDDPEPPSCKDVIEELTPCLDYLKGKDNKPSKDCCNGVEEVFDDNDSKQERPAAGWCLKAVLAGIDKYDPRRVSQIPNQCGLSVDLPPNIDDNFDCSK